MYNDQIAMVSPWMKNQNLSQYLTRHPQADRFKLIADAVAYLRDEDMVHGDIKCANILVSEDHTPQLADFGSAVIGKYTLAFTATTTGPHATLRWAAPEISNGESRHTFESDVYALGMVSHITTSGSNSFNPLLPKTILEIFTGSIPYNGLSDIAVIKCISQKIPPERPQQHIPIGKISSTLLWALMKSCWDKDPQSRPPALQIRDELKAIMEAQRFDDRLVAEEISADRLQVTDDYDLVTSTTTARNREHLSVQFDNIHNAISRLDEAGTIPTLSTIVATWLGIGSTASAEWGKIRQILEASDRGAKTMSKELANISKKISDFRNIYASRVQASIGNKRRYLGAQIETFLERVDGYRVQAVEVKDDLYKTLVDLEKLEADTSSLKEIYIACGIIIEELVVIESTTRVLASLYSLSLKFGV
ncbi:hypothetical protein FRC11_004169 [Ceratobasidium sp. 423]|nr:hypothetical protein FRC11_004169 [Ceratobasidium sp. 423]